MKKVLCAGTFDILHEGHMEFLKDVKKQGDYLIIFVISNDAAHIYKKVFPKNNQKTRVENLKKLNIADEIIPVEDSFDKNFKKMGEINLDIFAFGYDQRVFLEK
ncbi:MAG: adenylyltransferase/cytidyltransferase family protein, partial [Candidatus Pacearchaeota archaeon]